MANSGQSGFPHTDSPFIEPSGRITRPWYQLLLSLWLKAGGGNSQTANSAFVQSQNNGLVSIIDSLTGVLIGTISPSTPGPVQKIAVGASPFTYALGVKGTLTVQSGQVELSRDGTTFYLVSVTGGAYALLSGDQVRITYYGGPPDVVLFPT